MEDETERSLGKRCKRGREEKEAVRDEEEQGEGGTEKE